MCLNVILLGGDACCDWRGYRRGVTSMRVFRLNCCVLARFFGNDITKVPRMALTVGVATVMVRFKLSFLSMLSVTLVLLAVTRGELFSAPVHPYHTVSCVSCLSGCARSVSVGDRSAQSIRFAQGY
jgi:hypothetical protein